MAGRQDQKQVKSDGTTKSTKKEESADDIFEEISQRNLIPQGIVAEWEKFAIELGFSFGDVSAINRTASQLDVEEWSVKMLERWWNADLNPNIAELITALKRIQQNHYAQQLEEASKEEGFSFTEKFLLRTVAKQVAPKWFELGTQLGVKNMNNIQNIDNPVQYKYNKMLQKWLANQTGNKREIYMKIYKAMEGMEMNNAAEDFYRNAIGDIN